ncbi:MAG TPA: cell filamentation protein Fic, partial [Flavobacterium sp.]|nr:cell filamentation protein Fic [Flavobacterium sp.]
KKAHFEFEKYKENTKNEISEAEKHFIKQIDTTSRKIKKRN